MYVLDVKSQQNNLTEVVKKVSNDMFLKQIMKNRTKKRDASEFLTVFSNMFEFINEIFTTVDENKCHKTLTN